MAKKPTVACASQGTPGKSKGKINHKKGRPKMRESSMFAPMTAHTMDMGVGDVEEGVVLQGLRTDVFTVVNASWPGNGACYTVR